MIPEHRLIPGCIAHESEREILSNVGKRLSRTRRVEERGLSLHPGGQLSANRGRGWAKRAQVVHAAIEQLNLGLT